MTKDVLKQKIQTINQITGQRKRWALATVMVTMFFSSMDQTIVFTAINRSGLHYWFYYIWKGQPA